MRTQVAIVGAGPAGLLLGRQLERAGIDTVILETRSREYVEQRIRAGQLEQPTIDLLAELGLDARMNREGVRHEGIELRFGGRRHRMPIAELTGGRGVMMYGQQEIVRDAIAGRLDAGLALEFDVSDVRLHGIDGDRPVVRYRRDEDDRELRCDFVAGCDGWHGVSRGHIPDEVLRVFTSDYPFAWLGILAEAPAPAEVVYAPHPRGFALHSLRTATLSRFYLQVPATERLEAWDDARIWEELRTRLGDGEDVLAGDGEILQRGITAMRSCVCEPMRYGSLFLLGDAAHIVPPSAAKGLNLAVGDAWLLARALTRFYADGDREGLDAYAETALRRVWWGQEFSRQITWLMHHEDGDPWAGRLRHAALTQLCDSPLAAAAFSDQYVGLPFGLGPTVAPIP